MIVSSENSYMIIFYIFFVSLPGGVMSLGAFGSLIKMLAIFPILYCAIHYRFKVSLSNKILLAQFVMSLIMGLSCMYSSSFDRSITRTVTNIEFLILILVYSTVEFSSLERERLKKSLVWASRISAILILIFGTFVSNRLVLRTNFITEDANYMNGYFLFGVSYALLIILDSREEAKRRIIEIIELLVYVYIIVCTGSRTGVLMLIVTIVPAFIFAPSLGIKRNLNEIVKKIFYVVLIVFLVWFLVQYVIPSGSLERFSEDALVNSNNGSNRYTMWEYGLNVFKDSSLFRQIFGYGAGNIRSISWQGRVMHNIYLEILLEDGLLGFCVYIIFLIYVIRKSFIDNDLYSLSIILGYMMFGFGSSLYNYKPMWFIVLYICIMKENTSLMEEQELYDWNSCSDI